MPDIDLDYTVIPPLSLGDTFQDPLWMPETIDITKFCTYYIFSYTITPKIKFIL